MLIRRILLSIFTTMISQSLRWRQKEQSIYNSIYSLWINNSTLYIKTERILLHLSAKQNLLWDTLRSSSSKKSTSWSALKLRRNNICAHETSLLSAVVVAPHTEANERFYILTCNIAKRSKYGKKEGRGKRRQHNRKISWYVVSRFTLRLNRVETFSAKIPKK